jgi:hypothetical protein
MPVGGGAAGAALTVLSRSRITPVTVAASVITPQIFFKFRVDVFIFESPYSNHSEEPTAITMRRIVASAEFATITLMQVFSMLFSREARIILSGDAPINKI